MSGYMVPEVWCNGGCYVREQADGETTLTELRRNLADTGWCSHQFATVDAVAPLALRDEDRSGLVDYCGPRCCPACRSPR